MSRVRAATIHLDAAKAGVVGIEMNIVLRNMNLSLEHAEAFNTVFKAIFGHDHESMEHRRPKSAVDQALHFMKTGRIS